MTALALLAQCWIAAAPLAEMALQPLFRGSVPVPALTVRADQATIARHGPTVLQASGTPFSVSSGTRFLALSGVSMRTATVYISDANELRIGGLGIREATREAARLWLRPIMLAALVAALGLLPAAFSTGVGSASQRPFAMVIVGGPFSRLFLSVFLMPVLYLMAPREMDELHV